MRDTMQLYFNLVKSLVTHRAYKYIYFCISILNCVSQLLAVQMIEKCSWIRFLKIILEPDQCWYITKLPLGSEDSVASS